MWKPFRGSETAGAIRLGRLAFAGKSREEFIPPPNRHVERPRPERPSHPPLAATKVERVVNPPRAVVAPEMVPGIGSVHSYRWKPDVHEVLSSFSTKGKEPVSVPSGFDHRPRRSSKASPAADPPFSGVLSDA